METEIKDLQDERDKIKSSVQDPKDLAADQAKKLKKIEEELSLKKNDSIQKEMQLIDLEEKHKDWSAKVGPAQEECENSMDLMKTIAYQSFMYLHRASEIKLARTQDRNNCARAANTTLKACRRIRKSIHEVIEVLSRIKELSLLQRELKAKAISDNTFNEEEEEDSEDEDNDNDLQNIPPNLPVDFEVPFVPPSKAKENLLDDNNQEEEKETEVLQAQEAMILESIVGKKAKPKAKIKQKKKAKESTQVEISDPSDIPLVEASQQQDDKVITPRETDENELDVLSFTSANTS